MVSVSDGPAPTSPWGQLGSDGRQAPCEAEALVMPGCVNTAGTPTSGKIHQHSAHRESQSVVFILFSQSVHVPIPRLCSLMPSQLSSCWLLSYLVRLSFSPCCFSLTLLVLLYPRAKHISSIGHSQDQWRGKAREILKSRAGEEEGEGGVALGRCGRKKRPGCLL